jgi:hypothetical protein
MIGTYPKKLKPDKKTNYFECVMDDYSIGMIVVLLLYYYVTWTFFLLDKCMHVGQILYYISSRLKLAKEFFTLMTTKALA